jgi:hypothetical protein
MKLSLFAPLLLAGLAACSMPSLEALESLTREKKPETMASATGSGVKQDPMRLDTIAFADAYCRKDGLAAVAATQNLVVANPNHPRALLNYGLSLDLAGKGIAAYQVLDRLSKGNHPMPAVLRCGNDFMYSGTVTEVAQRRLFNIKTTLSTLGVSLPPPSSTDIKAAGNTIYRLAALAPPADEVLATSNKPKRSTAAPVKSHTPRKKPRMTGKGQHFVHLGSYKSVKTLDRGWRSLRKRFGKVLGIQAKTVSKVNLGRKKGQYLRLGVTVANAKTARAICKRLKAGGQYCMVRRSRKS